MITPLSLSLPFRGRFADCRDFWIRIVGPELGIRSDAIGLDRAGTLTVLLADPNGDANTKTLARAILAVVSELDGVAVQSVAWRRTARLVVS